MPQKGRLPVEEKIRLVKITLMENGGIQNHIKLLA
jgi:hypothetical protein